MSRIGNLPITIPNGAKVDVSDDAITIEGPKGKLSQPTHEGIEIAIDDGRISVSRSGETGPERARHGLVRALIANAITGVTEGFKKELEIVGVGYRGEVKGRAAEFALGYSHPVIFDIPDGIELEIDKQNKITVTGIDKQAVGQVAAEIRSLRKPDAYKGKGIRYSDEVVRLKVGKATGAAAG